MFIWARTNLFLILRECDVKTEALKSSNVWASIHHFRTQTLCWCIGWEPLFRYLNLECLFKQHWYPLGRPLHFSLVLGIFHLPIPWPASAGVLQNVLCHLVRGQTEQMAMTTGMPGNEQVPHIRVSGSCHLARNDSLAVWQQPWCWEEAHIASLQFLMWSSFQIRAPNQFFSSFQLRWAQIGWFPGNERNHIDIDSSPGWTVSGFREKSKHIKYRQGDAFWKHSSLFCDSQTDPKSMPPPLLLPPHLPYLPGAGRDCSAEPQISVM